MLLLHNYVRFILAATNIDYNQEASDEKNYTQVNRPYDRWHAVL